MPDAPDSAQSDAHHPRGAKYILTCIGVGLLAGLLSGLFGVGGGTVIVPLLVLILGFDQRLAAGTSLAAIVPTATVGVISYAVHDSVAWIPALILAVGAVGRRADRHLAAAARAARPRCAGGSSASSSS